MTGAMPLVAGIVLGVSALIALAVAIVGGQPRRVPVDRRSRPGTQLATGRSGGAGRILARAVDGRLAGSSITTKLALALDGAGVDKTPGEFLTVVLAATVGGAVGGALLFGVGVGVVLLLAIPLFAKIFLSNRAGKRRAHFADQLDDTLQLMSGSLRAGHSLLRAIDAVSREAEEPTSTEFSRIVNEVRVGRELTTSLDQAANRMASDDFVWITQAIAIHREVGGDLAEVLDTVSQTIRERNQIRRQVKALSAEGKLSGIVLLVLPLVVGMFLMVSNPGYLGKLTASPMGWMMAVGAGVLMVVGAVWLKKIATFKF
jgi:tight adherence protein B